MNEYGSVNQLPKRPHFSPSPSTSTAWPTLSYQTMDFSGALKELLVGNAIRRLDWKDEGYFGFLLNDLLKLHKPDGVTYDWIVSRGDIEGQDWIAFPWDISVAKG